MIKGFFENHSAFYAVIEPLHRHDFDIPLCRELVFLSFRVPRNQMSYTLCEVLLEFGSMLNGRAF